MFFLDFCSRRDWIIDLKEAMPQPVEMKMRFLEPSFLGWSLPVGWEVRMASLTLRFLR